MNMISFAQIFVLAKITVATMIVTLIVAPPAKAFELPKEEVLLLDFRGQIGKIGPGASPDFQPTLTLEEQELTLKKMQLVFDQIYSHTDLKIDFFKNPVLDPVSRISSLQFVKPEQTMDLLSQISRITLDLRDPHQSYQLPRPFSCLRTFIPIEMGFASFVPFDRRIVVKDISVEKLKNETLKTLLKESLSQLKHGDIVTKMNGEDVWTALNEAAIYGGGSNLDAFLYEGLFMLTYVSQRTRPLPIEDNLKLTIQTAQGEQEIEIPYLVKTSKACLEENSKSRPLFTHEGGAPVSTTQMGSKPKPLFTRSHPFSNDFHTDSARKRTRLQARSMNLGNYQKSAEPTVGSALVEVRGNYYGYLRIEEFTPEKDIETAQSEIERIVTEFDSKTEGLIIDVRGNPGGVYGDYLTQFFSSIPVEAQVEDIRASELNELMLEKMDSSTEDEWLRSYLVSVKKARAEGRKFTERLPINKIEYLNEKGRKYTKPVILLADPSCYSYCDYFSTSMQDHQAAEIWIENGAHTGGGGASVSSYEGFSKVLPELLPPLPQEQDMGIAFSSGYRTGKKAGVPIENLGADADHVYHTSFRDLKENDADLLEALGQRFQELSHSR